MGVEKFFSNVEAKRAKRSQERRKKKRGGAGGHLCRLCPVLTKVNGKVAKAVVVSGLVGSAVFKFPVFCAVCPIGITTRGLFNFRS
jgi:hypothetical protein